MGNSRGGHSSFGIFTAWKVRLVPVPSTVTLFTINKTLEQGAIKLLCRWQEVAHKLDEDLFIRASCILIVLEGKNLITSYNSFFLGDANNLVQVMRERFPELGLPREDCIETSYINSVLYLGGFSNGTAPEVYYKGRT